MALTILFADDDRSVRGMLKNIAEKRGHRVIEAADGAEAVAAYSKEHPDIIVLDVMMPHVDGPEALKKLQEKATLDVPVVMLSAVGGPFTRSHCIKLGAADYFTKPFRVDELFLRLEELGSESKKKRASTGS